jgi:hypothetical protein
MTKKVIPKSNITNFKDDLKVDEFGAILCSKFKSENLFWVRFFHHKTNRNRTIIAGTIAKK